MDSNPLTALGDRLRQARLERGLTQEALAQPEFTKSYISAVERGKARPSLKALELLARRLDLPLSSFLTAAPSADEVDLVALEEKFAYQLDQTKLLIATEHGDDALDLLRRAERAIIPHFAQFSAPTRYRFYRLRALAYLRLCTPGLARPDLEQAINLAQQFDDPQEVARARNVLGVVFYEQDMPEQALEQHQLGVAAIHQGIVKDLTLQLNLWRNLASDYWALRNARQAIAAYQAALALLEGGATLAQQARVYWDLSQLCKDADEPVRAKRYTQQAPTMYEAAANQVAIVGINVNLAELFLTQQEFAAAEQLLTHAQRQLTSPYDDLLLSTVYTRYAELYLQQGLLDQAAGAAQHSLDLSYHVYDHRMTLGDIRARANTARVYTRALSTAGEVAEQQDRAADADALFQEALALVGQAEHAETSLDLIITYADLLSQRGDHQQAAQYYRTATQFRIPYSTR